MDAQNADMRLRGGKLIAACAFVAVFLAYWAATCLFNFPDTSIVIGENYRAYSVFNSAFYQRWSFFAPPPTFNYRMNYIYVTRHKVRDVEVFEKINKTVQEKYLANDMQATISWMLFSNADAIVSTIGRTDRLMQLQEELAGDSLNSALVRYNKSKAIAQESPSMHIILTHARKLAENMHIKEDYTVSVKISTVAIPKYRDRNNPRVKPVVTTLFVSNPYDPKTKTWVN